MSVRTAQGEFLQAAVERLAGDERVAAVLLVGSAARGEADEWSDLDIEVVADDEVSAGVLSHPHEAERFGDLLVWVDCSFNAVAGGTMAFSRYGSDAGLVMVDWHVLPLSAARRTEGARVLWARPEVELEVFDGTIVDLIGAGSPRRIPPYSRQQRSEWELCMIDIAVARPPRGLDGRDLHHHIGVNPEPGPDPHSQLDGLERHLHGLRPWVAPRAFEASLARLESAREAVVLAAG